MHPDDYNSTITRITRLQDWITSETDKKHSMAVKYIEENVDLIDTDLRKFMDDCPSSCVLEVYNMLLKAGIDMKGYLFNSHKKYVYNPGSIYTIDYKQKLDDYIENILTYKPQYAFDSSVVNAPVIWR